MNDAQPPARMVEWRSHLRAWRALVRHPGHHAEHPCEAGFARLQRCVVITAWGWVLLAPLVLLLAGLHHLDLVPEPLPLGRHGTAVMWVSGVVVAPVLEELLFRGPLTWFSGTRYFGVAFYASAVLFGFVHLVNFADPASHAALTGLMVAPQMVLGLGLGVIRLTCGLRWSMASHSLHNAVVLSLGVLEGA